MKILDGEVLHGDHVRIDAHKGSSTLQFEVVSRAGIPLEHGVAIGQA
jgi:ATP-dependent Clp protease ATP-binding subunit ClpB